MLESAEGFIDAAGLVFGAARGLGVEWSAVMLHGQDGPAILMIDDATALSDAQRRELGIGEASWRDHPMFVALRERLRPLGAEVLEPARFGGRFPFVMPVIGPAGWFGTLLFSGRTPFSLDLERALTMLGTRFSVWCTERGIGQVPLVIGDAIPSQRYRIARLAARGSTNSEIAEALGISINTVKSRLKQVFVQLDVDNRTELAAALHRLAPLQDIRPGITRSGDLTITRSPYPNGYSARRRGSATSG
jgi:DNA-binding CsgD family transcriptional regulator